MTETATPTIPSISPEELASHYQAVFSSGSGHIVLADILRHTQYLEPMTSNDAVLAHRREGGAVVARAILSKLPVWNKIRKGMIE